MKKASKKNLILTIMLFVLVILVSVIIFLALSLLGKFNQVNNSVRASQNNGEQNTLTADGVAGDGGVGFDLSGIDTNILNDKDVVNILLIGQDRRSGETGRTRSDTMIIMSVNTKTNQLSLTSLMRDMYVPIPGYGANRINSAYVTGGMELLDAVIAQDFGVQIDANVEVDFDGFLTALAHVGPLDVTLTAEEAEYMTTSPLDGVITGEQPWEFHEGVNTLYSGALLQYARMRYVGNSDWDRTERQRVVIKLAFSKIKDMNIFSLLNLAGEILPTLTTDLSTREALGYAYAVISKGMSFTEQSMRLPIDGGYQGESINGMSVLVPDLKANAEALQNYIYGKVLNTGTAEFTETDLNTTAMEDNLAATATSEDYYEYEPDVNSQYSEVGTEGAQEFSGEQTDAGVSGTSDTFGQGMMENGGAVQPATGIYETPAYEEGTTTIPENNGEAGQNLSSENYQAAGEEAFAG